MNYDVQLRYSPQIRGSWEDVRISLIRPDGIGHESVCFNSSPLEEQERTIRLNEYDTSTIALPDLCLEEGKTYKFIVSFHRQSPYEPNPNAQILVDSVRNFVFLRMTQNLMLFFYENVAHIDSTHRRHLDLQRIHPGRLQKARL